MKIIYSFSSSKSRADIEDAMYLRTVRSRMKAQLEPDKIYCVFYKNRFELRLPVGFMRTHFNAYIRENTDGTTEIRGVFGFLPVQLLPIMLLICIPAAICGGVQTLIAAALIMAVGYIGLELLLCALCKSAGEKLNNLMQRVI